MIPVDKSPEMNVPAAFDGQPPYLARLHEMSFGELRKVIDDSLTALAEPGSDADRPRSKEEFLKLADMLDAKLDELRKEAAIPTPPPPAYDGPPYVPPWFNPSDQLSSLYDRHERFSERLLEAQGDPSSGKRYMDHVERELRDLEREIELRETGEKEEHAKRLADYEKASKAESRSYSSWIRQKQEQDKRLKSLAQREKIVQRIRRDIERKARTDIPTEHVRWRLLPPGELSEDRIREYYAGLQRKRQGTRYDAERIVQALSLGPNQRYEEIGGVEGYTVFTFPYTSSVLLECPIVGNAIYIVHKDWKRWSRMTKQELLADESGEVVRIVHRPGWFEKIMQELGTP